MTKNQSFFLNYFESKSFCFNNILSSNNFSCILNEIFDIKDELNQAEHITDFLGFRSFLISYASYPSA